MTRANTALLNFSGGEVSPEVYGRLELPAYMRGMQRIQNYEVLPQGALRYRNGLGHVHNTRSLAKGRLIAFAFSESDTFILELTDKKIRFYRSYASVVNAASATISGITNANPCVVTTSAAHGLTDGQEIFINGIANAGPRALNGQAFLITGSTATTFQLQNIFGVAINSTNMGPWTAGGTVQTSFEISSPYAVGDLNAIHFRQSADTITLVDENYFPYRISRGGNKQTISAATAANPGVFTTPAAHNFTVGDTVSFAGWIGGGWTALNEVAQTYVIATIPSSTTFTISQTGTAVDTTAFGGIGTFGNVSTNWAINYFTRTADPFNQQTVTNATAANPGVFTVGAVHNFAVGDTVYMDGFVGGTWTTLNRQPQVFTVNTVPSTTTFTLKQNGVVLDTTAFGAVARYGDVIDTNMCPKTITYLSSSRLVYANWNNNPAGLAGSRLPDSTTGKTRFDDFTTGANDDFSFLFTLAPVFDKQDAIQSMTSITGGVSGGGLVTNCSSSSRVVTGSTAGTAITPSSVNAPPVNNVGAGTLQAYSNGQSVYYVDQTGRRLESFLFSIQAYNFASVNQNLVSNQLSTSPFIAIQAQRREASLLWVLRADGVLLGLTFDEIESVSGWHRHYVGGSSTVGTVEYSRANVLSIAVEPRANDESVLWAIVERTLANGNTYRSVEYWKPYMRFVDQKDFYSGDGYSNETLDRTNFNNAQYEQVKKSVHVDCAFSYDGSALSTTVGLTPSATTGNITITADGAFFDATMVGREIWKAYDAQGDGGGRAVITGFIDSTHIMATTGSDFNTTEAIPAGGWYLTASTLYGLTALAGESLDVQIDGAPGGKFTVATDGSINVGAQASVVHVGYKFLGMAATMNIDLGGQKGTAQAKIRKVRQITPRFLHSAGGRIGTTQWDTTPMVFKDQNQVTDRPSQLYDDVIELTPEDGWGREVKQVFVLQDTPCPQTVLSIDVEVETADP